jgi:hypothetical protein
LVAEWVRIRKRQGESLREGKKKKADYVGVCEVITAFNERLIF